MNNLSDEESGIGKQLQNRAKQSVGDLPGQEQVQKIAQEVASLIKSGKNQFQKTENSKLQGDFASLCVLSYERPTFLRDTLKSLKDKPGAPYELIIHDDGSKDLKTRTLVQDEAVRGATVILNP